VLQQSPRIQPATAPPPLRLKVLLHRAPVTAALRGDLAIGRTSHATAGNDALLALVATPSASSVRAVARLRKGSTNRARGAARFFTAALITARKAGATGTVVLRADSAYYGHGVITAALRQGACFSITAR
jgi:hypothetical protein